MSLASVVEAVGGATRSRAAPWIAGAIGALLTWWLWGSLHALPWVYDEAAYLLQAKIFATGHWSAPGRPLPEFFEQMHVFVTPRLVPKYPPGHALLLVPGVWLGLPGLMPLLLAGLSGGLLYWLARALGNGWVALVAWVVWVTAPVELYIRPSYMSQATSGLVWLAGWWALWRWWTNGRQTRWLAFFAGIAAWGAITRPISMFPYLAVTGGWLLLQLWRERDESADGRTGGGSWIGRLGAMAAVGLPILGLAPLWSYEVSGRTSPTPYSEYSRVYVPWNMPGFSVDTAPPLRPPTPALRKFKSEFLPQHQAHTLARLPLTLIERVRWIGTTFWGEHGLRWILLPFGLIGLVAGPRAARIGVATFCLTIVTYLWIAARARWTVYYLEGMPVLAFATGFGIWWAVSRGWPWLERRSARARARGWSEDTALGAVCIAGLLVAVPGTIDRLIRAREAQVDLRLVPTELAERVAAIPGRAIVFLRAGPDHRPYESYVQNEPDLESQRVWLADDRGDDNQRLLALAPDRTAYLFDPGTGKLEPWRP